VIESYNEGDVVEGRVTKVVTFGAFVEILPGVEGLVHISELAQHHVENPREVVAQGDPVDVLILEIDADRRRLSLSLKRVDEGAVRRPRADGGESVHTTPSIDLSEDVFTEPDVPAAEREAAAAEPEAEAVEVDPGAEALPVEPETEAPAGEAVAEAVEVEAEAVEPVAEAPAVEPEASAVEREDVGGGGDDAEARAEEEVETAAAPERRSDAASADENES
jgi:small subunit ribosomal protein S1